MIGFPSEPLWWRTKHPLSSKIAKKENNDLSRSKDPTLVECCPTSSHEFPNEMKKPTGKANKQWIFSQRKLEGDNENNSSKLVFLYSEHNYLKL